VYGQLRLCCKQKVRAGLSTQTSSTSLSRQYHMIRRYTGTPPPVAKRGSSCYRKDVSSSRTCCRKDVSSSRTCCRTRVPSTMGEEMSRFVQISKLWTPLVRGLAQTHCYSILREHLVEGQRSVLSGAGKVGIKAILLLCRATRRPSSIYLYTAVRRYLDQASMGHPCTSPAVSEVRPLFGHKGSFEDWK